MTKQIFSQWIKHNFSAAYTWAPSDRYYKGWETSRNNVLNVWKFQHKSERSEYLKLDVTPKYIGTPVSKTQKTLGTRQSMFDKPPYTKPAVTCHL